MSSEFFRHLVRQIGAASILLALAVPTHSDELNMRSVGDEPANSTEGIVRPTLGMSMKQVLEQFGEPQSKLDAVGEPPITRWVYQNFVAFFEHQYVIHSVIPK